MWPNTLLMRLALGCSARGPPTPRPLPHVPRPFLLLSLVVLVRVGVGVVLVDVVVLRGVYKEGSSSENFGSKISLSL